MTIRQFLVGCCMLIVGSSLTNAQTDFRQRQLTMDDGLPSNSVRILMQDERGFLWMGTDNGLCRYDGSVASSFELPGKAGQQVTSLLSDSRDQLYVGTSTGVFSFSFINEQLEELPLKLSKPVTHLAKDQDGNLWVSTSGQGLICYQPADDEREAMKSYLLRDCGGMVNQVYVDASNQIWAVCNQGLGGLWRLNKTNNTFEPANIVNSAEAPQDPSSMLQTSDGRRWVATWEHGLWQLTDDGTMVPMTSSIAGMTHRIHSLTEYSATELLLCCDDGLWLFNTNDRSSSLYLPKRFVYAAVHDTEGGLWVGTLYGGVTYVSPIARRFEATPGGIINSFAEDRQGRLWVATNEVGVLCYSRTHHPLSFKGQEQLQHLGVHALCMDGNDLWMGTYLQGIYVLNTASGQLRQYKSNDAEKGLRGASINAIFADSKRCIWVATTEGLFCYEREADRFKQMGKLTAAATDIDEDAEGRIWVSTQGNGMFRLDVSGQTKSYHHEADEEATLSNDIVNTAFVDPSGKIWVGTQSGLCYYDKSIDNFRPIRLDVPRKAIASIAEDQGVLWLAGDFGVLKYSQTEDLQRFTRQDGLVSEQFQPNAVLKGSDGCIYFGTISGFNSFYPYQIKVNQLQPPVYITQLEIGTWHTEVGGTWHLPKSLTDIEQLDLWYNEKVFSLSFASLSYCSPEKNMYAYMLEGFDKDWNYVGNERKATYTNLPAGIYTFRVKATNNDGIWSDHVATLKIEVHPPYWWSTYAKILYVILAIALIVGFLRMRIKLVERRHRNELARLNEQKEQEMREARMEFFTTIAHEIRTPVSLIIAPLEELKTNLHSSASGLQSSVLSHLEIIDRNAHRLLDLVNQLLDFRKVGQQQELTFAAQNMTDLLNSVVANFAPTFKSQGRQFIVNLPNEKIIAAVDAEGITKVVSNLLSNANKYTRDTIRLYCGRLDADTITIEVGDNGKGIPEEYRKRVFEPFFQVAGSKAGTGIGLSIVKRIVEGHHGTVSVDSTEGQGTTFRIVLPLRQEVVSEAPVSVPESNEASAAPTEQAAPPVEEKKKMLIVDDNEDMLTFLVTTFMDNYDVTPARDGEQALELVRESLVVIDGQTPASAFDIVISDWMMERMDGPELCSRLRQNPATARLPFILLTAKTDSQSKVLAMDKGVDAFIEKPFNVKYLDACVNNLLKKNKKTEQ